MKKWLLLVMTFPLFALAQVATPENPAPTQVVDNLPQSSTFWGLFLAVVAFPFLARALDLLFTMFLNWRRAKGDKKAETYARMWALAGDAVGYVNAETKATREEVTSPDSPGGRQVTSEEAKKYQDAARAAIVRWLGTEGVKAVFAEMEMAAEAGQEWLQGLIQKRFEAQKAVADLSPSIVNVVPPVPVVP